MSEQVYIILSVILACALFFSAAIMVIFAAIMVHQDKEAARHAGTE